MKFLFFQSICIQSACFSYQLCIWIRACNACFSIHNFFSSDTLYVICVCCFRIHLNLMVSYMLHFLFPWCKSASLRFSAKFLLFVREETSWTKFLPPLPQFPFSFKFSLGITKTPMIMGVCSSFPSRKIKNKTSCSIAGDERSTLTTTSSDRIHHLIPRKFLCTYVRFFLLVLTYNSNFISHPMLVYPTLLNLADLIFHVESSATTYKPMKN